MPWYPHKTVAVVVEQPSSTVLEADTAPRFLMVEEHSHGRVVFNQPAGHLDPGESLTEAAIRETLEETGWQVELTAFIGLYQYTSPENGECYIRSCFSANAICCDPKLTLDPDIIAAHWMRLDELLTKKSRLRSPVVLRVIQDYLKGQRYPLELIADLGGFGDRSES